MIKFDLLVDERLSEAIFQFFPCMEIIFPQIMFFHIPKLRLRQIISPKLEIIFTQHFKRIYCK